MFYDYFDTDEKKKLVIDLLLISALLHPDESDFFLNKTLLTDNLDRLDIESQYFPFSISILKRISMEKMKSIELIAKNLGMQNYIKDIKEEVKYIFVDIIYKQYEFARNNQYFGIMPAVNVAMINPFLRTFSRDFKAPKITHGLILKEGLITEVTEKINKKLSGNNKIRQDFSTTKMKSYSKDFPEREINQENIDIFLQDLSKDRIKKNKLELTHPQAKAIIMILILNCINDFETYEQSEPFLKAICQALSINESYIYEFIKLSTSYQTIKNELIQIINE